LIKKIVFEIDIAQFPEVIHQQPDLRRRQIEPVLPKVAIFNAVVLVYFLMVMQQAEKTGITAEHALPRVQDRIVLRAILGAEVYCETEPIGASVDIFRIDTQKGMAEHGRR